VDQVYASDAEINGMDIAHHAKQLKINNLTNGLNKTEMFHIVLNVKLNSKKVKDATT
jgi:hypothetical protein